MHDLIVVKDKIIARGFPELHDVDISLEYQRMRDAFFKVERVNKGNFHIEVDKKLGRAPKGVLKGGLAHDIAHIARDYKRSWFMHEVDMFLYNVWENYKTRDERETDLLVVERGYGPALLKFLKYADKRREEFTTDEGLTVKELETILKFQKECLSSSQ